MVPAPSPGAITASDQTIPLRSPNGLRSVVVRGPFWRKFLAFSGPGYLVAVGYMDPGNWATGLAGGAAFGYQLLSIILLSNLMAMFLQSMAARLGIASGLDLAQACRQRYGKTTRIFLWLLCEVAIVACDLAELIGAAIALKLLFGVPMLWGVVLTGLEVLLILALQQRGVRKLEAFVIGLIAVIAVCFAVELALATPDLSAVARGLLPSPAIITNPQMLYISIGILGATVMPHNLYLHSSIVQSRRYERTAAGLKEAIRFSTIDIVVALSFAIFVNASILILAAATFHGQGVGQVGIEEAYHLLAPALGVGAASTLFALALLASGQNSSITGTLAGQIVMEGFTDFRWPAWQRRILSRLLAMVPAALAIAWLGDAGATRLLIFSQVMLSLQLPFAVYPLVRLTNSRTVMGRFANGRFTAVLAWAVTAVLVILNGVMLTQLML